MRRWAWAPFVTLVVLSLAVVMPVSAKDPRIIIVDASDFQPATITIQRGDVVEWKLQNESGTHVIMSGEYQTEDAGTIAPILQFSLNADNTTKDITFNTTGTFSFFDQSAPESMHGTITVTSATPVELTTWGRVKHLFETP